VSGQEEAHPPADHRSTYRCPVCRARFRGSAACSRCGADLEPLMRLAVRGLRLRLAARRALLAGDPLGAREILNRARQVHATPEVRRLGLLAAWWLRSGEAP